MKYRFMVISTTVIGTMIACNGTEEKTLSTNESSVKIVGGEAVASGEFNSVIKMVVEAPSATSAGKICTGVIISHRTVLAASHCIKRRGSTTDQNGKTRYHFVAVEGEATRAKIPLKSPFAVTYKEPLGVDSIAENHIALDLAVLDFGQNAFNLPVYPRIASKAPHIGEKVTLVGFGATSFNPGEGTTGSLNKGTNQVMDYSPAYGYIKLSSSLDAQGSPKGALAAPGDSGGPLFNANGELIGIGSALELTKDKATNYFVDLSSQESKILLSRYLEEFGATSSGPLIAGVSPTLAAKFEEVKPRTENSRGQFVAMCGGKDKGKGSERGRDDERNVLTASGTPSLDSPLGRDSGNGAAPSSGGDSGLGPDNRSSSSSGDNLGSEAFEPGSPIGADGEDAIVVVTQDS